MPNVRRWEDRNKVARRDQSHFAITEVPERHFATIKPTSGSAPALCPLDDHLNGLRDNHRRLTRLHDAAARRTPPG